MDGNKLIKFDRRIPFVDAVFRIIEGKGSKDEAIEIFEAAEKKHGLKIIHPPAPYDPDTWRHIRKDPKQNFTLADLLDIYEKHQIGEYFDEHPLYFYEHLPKDGPQNNVVFDNLYPFLTETNFLIPRFGLDHFISFSKGEILGGWTMRGWGALLADWANKTAWMSLEWSYVDFSWDILFVEDYNKWMAVALDIVRIKSEKLYLDPNRFIF